MAMTPRNRFIRGAIAALAVVTVACSRDQATPLSPDAAAFNVGPGPEQFVKVFKMGPAGTYNFEAGATGGTLLVSSFALDAGDGLTIWRQNDPIAPPADVTVSELVTSNMQVDSIIVHRFVWGGVVEITKYTGQNSVTASNLDAFYGAHIWFYNSVRPPSGGGEGCTPGFWRQTQWFSFWTAPYTPTTLFSDVFENAFPGMTLHQVVQLGSGGLNALGRHAVAALLNAASADVDYAYTTQEVIDAFNAVFPGGDYEGLKDDFEYENELGCGLGMDMLQ